MTPELPASATKSQRTQSELTLQSFDLGACLHERFEQQVERTPDAVALVWEDESLSYAQLNRRANWLAHHLRELGVTADQLVGLHIERGIEMVVGIIGILKAGAAYLPLDPVYPRDRVAFMLEDSGVQVVVTQESLIANLEGSPVARVLCGELLSGLDNNPAPVATANNLAYVIYTSGSTGRPKGALITHYNVTRLFDATESWYHFGEQDVWTLFHSYAFDFSVWELWGALLNGGRLVVVPYWISRSPEDFRELLVREGVTVLNQTPSAFRQLIQVELAQANADLALRYVIFGGEALELQSLRPWFVRYGDERPELVNMYGITETTVHVTYRPIHWADLRFGQGSVIGVPIPDLQLYILEPDGEPASVGVPGEIYVGGAGVARGYLNRAELTAERFIADPFSPVGGALLYRTGDLARRLENGDIEYLGRIDHQVKIRGFRIELGEIESVIATHPAIAEVVVIAREDAPGDKRLVAYIVAVNAPADLANQLRELLRVGLPEYMVPAHFVSLGALPLTENGKVDRNALPAPDRAAPDATYVAPRTPTEETLAGIWAEILGLERVGIHDNFFELGGHSLLVVNALEKMRKAELHASVRTIFLTPTIAELAGAVAGVSDDVEVPPNLIPADCQTITPDMLPLVQLSLEEIERVVAAIPGGVANIQDIYPLPPMQEGMLFHHRMASTGDPYLVTTIFGSNSRELLDRYIQALQLVIDRHDILRTAFLWEDLSEPVQVVCRRAPLIEEELRFDPANGDIVEQLEKRFDPRQYRLNVRLAPIIRIFIAHDAANARWVMLRIHHHLLEDHTTDELMSEEIHLCLQGQAHLLPAALPFRDFVAQTRLGIPAEEHRTFFRHMLADVDEPTLPFGLTDVQGNASKIAEARSFVDSALASRLRETAHKHGASAASLFHLAWAKVLSQCSGRDDVVFGTVLIGRMHAGQGAERVLGPFINTLPLRLQLGDTSVKDGVRQTHTRMAELLGHEHASLAVAQGCSAVPATGTLFNALLNFRHLNIRGQIPETLNHAMATAVSRMGLELLKFEERTNFPLELSVDDLGDGFMLEAQAQSPVDPQRICNYMHTALEQLVVALETSPTSTLRSLNVLPGAERQQLLVEWNDTARNYGDQARLHRLIEKQAAQTPDSVALEFDGQELTYAELNRRANQLARLLRQKGAGLDDLVGVFAERSFEMVLALLAVLKAGGAYVPLDPSYPPERLAHMLEDAQACLVLTQPHLAHQLPAAAKDVLLLDASWKAYGDESGDDLEDIGTPESLAYVIFTSGSTGRPKGAMNEHRGICNRLLWMQEQYGLSADDRILQKTPFSFDVSVWEFFWPLVTGARLVIARPEGHRDSAYLVELIRHSGITTLHFVPSMLRMFLEQEGVEAYSGSLKRVICSGEALPHELQERFFARLPGAELHNLYGPTEAAVDVTYWACQRGDTRLTVPIGRPVANTQMYVLDTRMEPVPVGVAGELYIGGVQVGRGYMRRDDLTVERFVPDPFARELGARLYKTGDLARYLADGAIEYLGRTDFQVKIRGQRIELGEIEAMLNQHAGVAQSIVMMREDHPGDQRLVAYVVPRQADLSATVLKEHLSVRLPSYMVPSALVLLDELPLTSSGKIDRKGLPAPEYSNLQQTAYVAPQTPTEETLVAIWTDVLNLARVGIHDNFFELGGHSLLAVSVIERMRRAGLQADVRGLFLTPTIAELASAVGAESNELDVPANLIPPGCEAITPDMLPMVQLSPEDIARVTTAVPGGAANIQDIYPLATLQEGFLFHHLLTAEGDLYIMETQFAFDSRERLDRYLQALQWVVDRNDIMRTVFLWQGLHEPVQVVCRKAPVSVEELILDPADGDIAEQLSVRNNLLNYRLDLSLPPMIRIFLAFDAANERWVFHQLTHHLMDDQASVNLQEEELQAYLQGRVDQLPAPRHYRDYVAQARLGVPLEEHEAFFRELLGDVTEPTAPFGFNDVLGNGSRVEEARSFVGSSLALRLREMGQRTGVSTASLFHLAWAKVMSQCSGQDDVVFGTVLLGRMQGGQGADRVLGPCINTLPIRLSLGDVSVEECVRQAQALLAKLLRHEHAPLGLVQRCSAVGINIPVFNSILNYRRPSRGVGRDKRSTYAALAQGTNPNRDEQLTVSEWFSEEIEGRQFIRFLERTNYPLTLSVDDFGGGFRLVAQVQAPIDPQRICSYMHTALEQIVGALESSPTAPIRSLGVMPDAERHELLEGWNNTQADYPRDHCIHQLFEAQVERTPDAVAVVFEREQLTYRELNRRANQLAHYLRKLGVGPEVLVGICLERSLEMVIGLLGILKAGGAYVPLDTNYPKERLSFILENARVPILLTQRPLLTKLPAHKASGVCLDRDWASIAKESEADPSNEATSRNLAYIIYTSGSTGKPKGVAIEHRSTVAFLSWAKAVYASGDLEGVLASTSICFDLSVFELFCPLTSGGRAILAKDALELPSLPNNVGVTLVNTVPSAITELLRTDNGIPRSVRTVNLAGEPLSEGVVRQLYQRETIQQVFDLYGPSEDTTYSTYALRKSAGPATIGRPITNTQIYLLDRDRQPVPLGVPGELHIGGDGLARGYLDRAELTSEKFTPDPFSNRPGARLYSTGDLARYLPDGNIEFLGRLDQQVKIRGFRIELGEIEAILGHHPQVVEAIVAARENGQGEKRLVAYVVPEQGQAVTLNELRSFLKQKLPDYMVPSTFVFLDVLPLTPNGKVDRKALPEPEDSRPELIDGFVAPSTPIETALAEMWMQVLGVEKVGIHDNFFDLGGNSLLAMRLINQIEKVLGKRLPLASLFQSPTIEGLAENLQDGERSKHASLMPLRIEDSKQLQVPAIQPRRKADQPLPLSFAQQRLWFIDRLLPGSSLYNVPLAVRLRGRLDIQCLRRSLEAVVRRHEVLRTTIGDINGEPFQVVAQDWSLRLAVRDLTTQSEPLREKEASSLLAEEAFRPFDLARDLMLRAMLIELTDEEHVLLLVMHHIASDGWSLSVLMRELSHYYQSFLIGKEESLEELPLQYADYAIWQREWLQAEVLEKQLSYWKQNLAGAPRVLELPTDRPRPAIQTFQGASQRMQLPPQLVQDLKLLCRREKATLFMTLLAAFQLLLSRYTGRDDIVVGSPIAGRNRQEAEDLIGFFVNTLVLRTDLSGDPTFLELLGRVRGVTLGAYAHQDVPFERLVDELQAERDLSHHSLVQVMFVLQNAPQGELVLSGLDVSPFRIRSSQAKFDLTLSVAETESGMTVALEYNTGLFASASIERMLAHFRLLLQRITAHPEHRLSRLPLLTEEEWGQLKQWNDTRREYPRDRCLAELFEAQVARRPEAVAVVCEDREVTYGGLNRRANQLGHYLKRRGVGPEVRVGICMNRSVEMVVGLLGILKAGGAYVPLDRAYPGERLNYMIRDAGMSVLLTEQQVLEGTPDAKNGLETICLDRDWSLVSRQSETNPRHLGTAETLAYVMYTSGSTGQPKGVGIPQRAVSRLVLETNYARFGEEEVFLQMAPTSFDASTFELWGALLNGSRCVLYPGGLPNLKTLGQVIERHRVTTLWLTASLFNTVIDDAPEILIPVRQLLIGGEALSVTHVRQAIERLPNTQIINGYGPTENTTFTCCHTISKVLNESRSISIGTAIANTQVYLLDRYLNPVPVGVVGELYTGGESLARGYCGRADLTAERFVPNPFGQTEGERLYRTGDLARYLPDGSIEFIGRADNQVKIRGHRIELSEIEFVLKQHPAVRDAVVRVQQDGESEKRLVGYVVMRSESAGKRDGIREFLKTKLPDYMIPGSLVMLENLPLTANGKIDYKALAASGSSSSRAETGYVAGRDEVERKLIKIWEELLGTRPVGVNDNFFDLGGHSLLATRLIARIEKTLGSVSLSTLFQSPTIEGLARELRKRKKAKEDSALVLFRNGGSRPPLFLHGGSFELTRYLGEDQPCYGIRPHGQDGRRAPATVEEMAADYLKQIRGVQPQGPYLIGGFSFGGLVAYEMAQQLRQSGQEVGLLVLIEPTSPRFGIPTDFAPSRAQLCSKYRMSLFRHWTSLRRLDGKQRVEYLMGELKWRRQHAPNVLKILLCRAYLSAGRRIPLKLRMSYFFDVSGKAVRRYSPKPYDAKVVLLKSEVAGDYSRSAWRELIPNQLEVHELPGQHLDPIKGPNVKAWGSQLKACLVQILSKNGS